MVRTAPDALLTAIRMKDRSRISTLLAEDPLLVTSRATGGESLVLHACYVGAPELADILHPGRPIGACEAAALGDVPALRVAIESDDDARVLRSSDGWTPLHLAAFFGHDDAVRLLIDHGAPLDAHSTNAMRNTPLHAALAGITPLHLAASRGNDPLCELFLTRGANVHALSNNKSTPAMLAFARGFTDLGTKLTAGHGGPGTDE